jgi:dihydroneopterin aldolase
MMDEIFLEGMRFYAYHGVNPEERVQGQRFTVDLVIEADARAAGETDDLTKTVNYSKVYEVVRGIVEGEPKKLIETVAEKIAAAVLDQFPLARAVTVTVRKPEVAIKGSILDESGVRIRRSREASDQA